MTRAHKGRWLIIALLVLAGLAQALWQSQPAKAAVGFRVSGRNILDANGNNFIMRGVSHAHVWYPSQTSSFANIKATGANVVRVVLGGGRWGPNSASDVANVISLCKTNKLVCMLENHDTTGYGEQSGSTSLAQAVAYWKSIQSVLTGQENYVIINIGNEPYGNNNPSGWIADTKAAIVEMRNAGFQHMLVVDAPNWGQDWQFIMRDNAPSVFAADTQRNTVFSVHMYGVYNTAQEVTDYVGAFATMGLPLIIGEFGHNHSDGDPDENTIMATAQSQGIGYIGWSWSGNGGGVEYLDMVLNFDPAQRTSWGTRIIDGANGIRATSREASIYSGTVPTASRTRTATQGTGATATRTRTATQGTGATATRTRTATQGTGATATRTRTATTGTAPTATRTPTTGTGGTCSPATAITAPFTFDGSGTRCWQIATIPSYINSWNLNSLTINGVSFTNMYATPSQLPAKINGYWYISYNSSYAWGHFEAR